MPDKSQWKTGKRCNISYRKYNREAYMLIKLTSQTPFVFRSLPNVTLLLSFMNLYICNASSQQNSLLNLDPDNTEHCKLQWPFFFFFKGQAQQDGEGLHLTILTVCHKNRGQKTNYFCIFPLIKYPNSGKAFLICLRSHWKHSLSITNTFVGTLFTHNTCEIEVWNFRTA